MTNKLLYAIVAAALCACGGNTPPATQAEQLAAQIVAQPAPQSIPTEGFTKSLTKRAPFGPRSTLLASVDGSAAKVCASNSQGAADSARCGAFRLPPVAAHARQYLPFGLSKRAHAVVAVSERNGQLRADLCVLVTNQYKVHCRPVSAPLPQGYDLGYGELADQSPAVTFTPRAGTPRNAADLMMANRFAVALRAAAKQARALVAATPISTTRGSAMLTLGTTPGTAANFGTHCYAEEVEQGWCIPEDDPDDPGTEPDPWGGDPGTEPDPFPDPGTEPDPYGDPGTEPDPYSDPGIEPDPSSPPPEDPAPCVEVVANRGASLSLVTSAQIFPIPAPPPPIACPIVYVPGRRPPPAEEPRNPTPWFPQSWCNFLHILCTAGQVPEDEPVDNNRGSGSSQSGKTMEELYQICEAIERVEREVCRANRPGMDNRSFQVCLDNATNRKIACYETARKRTDNGAHPAP
jgi:hypothetical protein